MFKKKIMTTLLAVIVFIASMQSAVIVNAEGNDSLNLSATSAILIDAESGKILYEKAATTPLPIASMTKMMSEYLVHEAVKSGKINWDSEVTVSDLAHKISQQRSLSNVPLELGGKYTVKELYEAMAIYSANGATIALAEFIAGSEANFVKMMNEMGNKLQLGEFNFVNSTGLNNKDMGGKHPEGTEVDDENMMSASAAAKLAYLLLKKYPDVLETSKIPKKVFQEGGEYPVRMDNWNWMLPGLVYQYEGVDGLKTGSTDTAGYCFTGTAKRGDFRLISVVIASKDMKSRFDDTQKLLDYGYNNYELKEVFPAGYEIKGHKTINIKKAKEKEEAIETKQAVRLPVSKGAKATYEGKFVPVKKELEAPLKKGTVVGTMQVVSNEKDNYGYITGKNDVTVDVVTTSEVEKANFFTLIFRAVGSFFSDLFHSAVNGIKGLF
ncbi:MAG: D-alanyl-D-alanine carboxypeptidase family protein [Bacillaceae bacterium]